MLNSGGVLKGYVDISEEELSIEDMVAKVRSPRCGAVVTFLGTVRADPGVEALEVEDKSGLSIQILERVREEAKARFDIEEVAIAHRVGRLPVGQEITLIAVSAPHREDAFKACKYVIDELKARTPIWKTARGN